MAAFEQEHKRRLQTFEKHRQDACSVSKDEVDYLLNVGMLIKEFHVDREPVKVTRPDRHTQATRKPRKRRELSAVEKSGSVQAWVDVRSQQLEGAFLKKYSDQFGSQNIDTQLQTYDMNFVKTEDADVCPTCKVPCVIDGREATLICTECGLSRDHMEGTSANMTYDQEMSIATSSNSPYERMNHLNELLAQIQGKETTIVPERLLAAVKVEFRKDGLLHRGQVTSAATLRYLKRLGESDWVSSISHHHGYRRQQQPACISVLPGIENDVNESEHVSHGCPARLGDCSKPLLSAAIPRKPCGKD